MAARVRYVFQMGTRNALDVKASPSAPLVER